MGRQAVVDSGREIYCMLILTAIPGTSYIVILLCTHLVSYTTNHTALSGTRVQQIHVNIP